MRTKKLLSLLCAAAITITSLAGLALTSNAENDTKSVTVTVAEGSAKAAVTTTEADAVSGVLILAKYDEGKLDSVTVSDTFTTPAEDVDLKAEYAAADKLLAWDSITGMVPYKVTVVNTSATTAPAATEAAATTAPAPTQDTGVYTVTLAHSNDATWDSTTGANKGTSHGLDAEVQYFNNERGASSWGGAAYFQFTGIDTLYNVEKAVVTFSGNQGGRSGRDSNVYYITDTAIDLSQISNEGAYTGKKEWVGTLSTTASGDFENVEVDITKAVQAMVEAGSDTLTLYITNNAGGATINGKGAASGQPVITVTKGTAYVAPTTAPATATPVVTATPVITNAPATTTAPTTAATTTAPTTAATTAATTAPTTAATTAATTAPTTAATSAPASSATSEPEATADPNATTAPNATVAPTAEPANVYAVTFTVDKNEFSDYNGNGTIKAVSTASNSNFFVKFLMTLFGIEPSEDSNGTYEANVVWATAPGTTGTATLKLPDGEYNIEFTYDSTATDGEATYTFDKKLKVDEQSDGTADVTFGGTDAASGVTLAKNVG